VHKKETVCIIGAGASGIVASISAKRRGADVILVDRMPQIGRKLLVCGAGRCNLLNERLDESFYNEAARALVVSVFRQFGGRQMRSFFSDLGLVVYAQDGRIFPVTNQASSVLEVLSIEMKRLGIVPRTDFEVTHIGVNADGFVVKSNKGVSIRCSQLIIATGGKSYPQLGSNGSGLALAIALGHSVVEPVPAVVPLVVRDSFCHNLQGVRVFCRAKVMIDGQEAASEEGDLLFTRYGVSGTAILDVSRQVSVAMHREKGSRVSLFVDLVPFMEGSALKDELIRRFKKGIPSEYILAGVLPDKFYRVYKSLLKLETIDGLVAGLKQKEFSVSGTRSWDEAEFTAGGISTDEVDPATLVSKLHPGLYLCGEVLDVDGKRGGYNLAWAWASGLLAGLGAIR
jgi:predicted Rossmann fold flavoprotein